MDRMTHNKTPRPPIIALYQPDIPQNTASIIRTCSCFGIKVEIIEPCGFSLEDKRFKRVVMDYYDKKMIKNFMSWNDFINFKKEKNQRVLLLTTKAKKSFLKFKFKPGDTILFGRESAGATKEVHNQVNERLTIPIKKNKRSLNLSSSVSIIICESLRQIKYI
tara:strand:- start:157 stop:645 length:489 start_codon:yes stop_codon:yes gene_type:complete